MANLYFRYGTMGSSKTASALMTRYNFTEKGQNVLLVKPNVDTRDVKAMIKSRIGLEAECILWTEFIRNYVETDKINQVDAVVVDEVQFLERGDIDILADVVDQYNIPVFAYGLRTDFTGHLFSGSGRLMEVADIIEEMKTICWCGKKATMNARIDENGNVIKNGEQIVMGANDLYVSLCRKHYKEGRIK